jgi:hypothetical protein
MSRPVVGAFSALSTFFRTTMMITVAMKIAPITSPTSTRSREVSGAASVIKVRSQP